MQVEEDSQDAHEDKNSILPRPATPTGFHKGEETDIADHEYADEPAGTIWSEGIISHEETTLEPQTTEQQG